MTNLSMSMYATKEDYYTALRKYVVEVQHDLITRNAELAAARAENANLLQANKDCLDHFEAMKAEAERNREDAERWDTFCTLWAASTEMRITQDDDGGWSIFQVEDVEGVVFKKLTGETPNATIDAARRAG